MKPCPYTVVTTMIEMEDGYEDSWLASHHVSWVVASSPADAARLGEEHCRKDLSAGTDVEVIMVAAVFPGHLRSFEARTYEDDSVGTRMSDGIRSCK